MLGYKKGNKKGLCGQMPLHYPADRVYLDGDKTKTVQDAITGKQPTLHIETATTAQVSIAANSGDDLGVNISSLKSQYDHVTIINVQTNGTNYNSFIVSEGWIDGNTGYVRLYNITSSAKTIGGLLTFLCWND